MLKPPDNLCSREMYIYRDGLNIYAGFTILSHAFDMHARRKIRRTMYFAVEKVVGAYHIEDD